MRNYHPDVFKIKSQFQLGTLPTETPHPKTHNLSTLCHADLPRAFELFHQIDSHVFEVLKDQKNVLLSIDLHHAIVTALQSGGKIFLVGCGATGRLSLSLETFFRQTYEEYSTNIHNLIVSFMAGGDVALIHSIEKFEDFPEYGARQLRDLGFSKNDLLIASTEGGETPFVIGATEEASLISQWPPYFLYCNPDEVLVKAVERSRKIIENPNIKKVNLTVGPMALTGSTRLQASTILMAFIGFPLLDLAPELSLKKDKAEELAPYGVRYVSNLEVFTEFHKKFSYDALAMLTEFETRVYENQGTVIYRVDKNYGITFLTDTTERSPTFSLHSFENFEDGDALVPSLVYLSLDLTEDDENTKSPYEYLLHRKPRTFHWEEVTNRTTEERLQGFYIGRNVHLKRKSYLKKPDEILHIKEMISSDGRHLVFSWKENSLSIDLKNLGLLERHLMIKMILNAHSTLIMGRLKRFESNLMTYVRPSNFKLIDRAVRYSLILLKEKKIHEVPYEDIVDQCIQWKDSIHRDEPIVLKLVEKFSKEISL